MQGARGGGKGAYGRSRSHGLSDEQLERMSYWEREERKRRKERKFSGFSVFWILVGVAATLWLLL